MGLKKHRLDLVTHVEELTERLDEIEDEQNDVIERAEQYEANDEPVPDELEAEWDELEAEKIEKQGNKKKFIEAVVCWSPETDIVYDEPSPDERLVSEAEWDEITTLFGQIPSCNFTVQELTFGQLQAVSDEMMDESFEVDVRKQDIEGTPKQGFYQIELLRAAVVDAPAGAPSSTDEYGNPSAEPGDYPIPVSEWLYDRVDALNTTGDTEMGNSSLADAMNSQN